MAIPTRKPPSGASDSGDNNDNNMMGKTPVQPKQRRTGDSQQPSQTRQPAKRKKAPAKRDPYAERAVYVEDNSEKDSTNYAEMSKKQLDSEDDSKKQKKAPDKYEEIDVSSISVSVDTDALNNPDFAKDPITGKIYQKIPKTKMDSNGMPMIQTDIDDLDLEGAANKFLAHLRVPPSKEEIEKMRQERIERAKQERIRQQQRKQNKNRSDATQEELKRLYDQNK